MGEFGTALVSKLEFPTPGASVHTENKDTTNKLVVRICTPAIAPQKQLRIGLFIHGGGYATGDLGGRKKNDI
jgi:acetyl esterase/lipase